MDINKIVDDFEACRSKNTCQECKANKPIDDSGYTYCELLDKYAWRLRNRIIKVIEQNQV